MRFRGTLAARVTLLATVAVGVSVALVAAAAYLTVKHQLIAALDHSLLSQASSRAQTPELADAVQSGLLSRYYDPHDVWIAVVYADGDVFDTMDGSSGAHFQPGPRELAVAAGGERRSTHTVRTPYGDFRVAVVSGFRDGTALVLAETLRPTYEALNSLGFMLAVFGLLGVVVAGFAGWGVALNGLSPVRRLTLAVEEIARTQRLDPIAVEGNDELARLATAFNTMLASLAASRDRQRQLVADAGHELRTPLTSLRTNLDLLTQAEQRGGLSEKMRDELMSDVRFQIDELTTLIGDLTELARDEPITAQLEPVDLGDVVERAVQRVRRRATSLRFDVSLEPWPVTGEATSLERAVINLLDNAAKWSPPMGVVTVRLKDGVLYVADQGGGISEEDLPHVFERFYRSKESRTLPGSGLGLSIVRQVAERHGGAVRAGASPEGGAAFWMWLPASTDYPDHQVPAGAQSPLSVTSGPSETLDL